MFKEWLTRNSRTGLGLGILGLVCCGFFLTLSSSSVVIQRPSQLKVIQPSTVKSVLHHDQAVKLIPIPAVHLTAAIGTVDHPTIDGGQLNAAEQNSATGQWSFSIQQPEQPTQRPVAELKKIPNPVQVVTPASFEEKPMTLVPDQPKKFNDTWFTAERVERILNRAAEQGKLQVVIQKAHQLHVPETVALVPIIESAYQDEAQSPKGAAGAWQLMPALAHDYQLPLAARNQFNPATEVALTELKQLHGRFGNWSLALAAYNAGSGRVHHALVTHPNAVRIEELELPQETVRYVSTLENLSQLLEEQT